MADQRFFAAARNNNVDALRSILQSGANVNERFNSDRSALHYACDSCQLQAVQVLLQFGADVNMQDLFNKDTPLHIACEKGQLQIVKVLLEYKANPNLRDQLNDETPLHLACEGGYTDIARLLLDKGADPKTLNIYNKTAFFYASTEMRVSLGFTMDGERGHEANPGNVPGNVPLEKPGGRQGRDMERAKAIAQSSQFRQEGDMVVLHVAEQSQMTAVRVQVGSYSHAGEDPGGASKANQDAYFVQSELGGDPGLHMFGVFDGHGRHGHMVSQFCRNRFCMAFPIGELVAARNNPLAIEQILNRMFMETQSLLERQKDFDAQGSGTTAVVLLVVDGILYSANCGDSRAVLGRRQTSKQPASPAVVPVSLTADHVPDVPSERDRIVVSGGVVRRDTDEFTGEQGPMRVWRKDMTGPGLAMSRSLGDLNAHRIGVSATPEVTKYKLEEDDLFFIIASDGIWDMIPNDEVVEICYQASGMLSSACQQLHDIARECWKLKEGRVDDITAVAVALHFPKMLYAL